ncbi:hypothetical protein LJK87_25100 [Paenibacillus sp. P25]|nr:hypothetical protein LJK87_25100 [Paenibacillus sp. P25]
MHATILFPSSAARVCRKWTAYGENKYESSMIREGRTMSDEERKQAESYTAPALK